LIIILAVSSYSRNTAWHDDTTLYEDVIRKSPRKPRAYTDLGYYYFKHGMLDKALLRFQLTIIWNPNYAPGFCNIGAVYLKKGYFDQAIASLERAVALAPGFGEAYLNLGFAYQAQRFFRQVP